MPEKTGLQEAALYIGKLDGMTAIAALQKLPARDGLNILVYTPAFCGFVKVDDERLIKLAGDGISLESVFELRAFCADFDLRWVREKEDGTGRRTILAETSLDGLSMDKADGEFFKQSGRYLLWGKGKGGRLFAHRIGELPVPLNVPDKASVYLNFDEYFRADDYGNRVWYAERLTGLTAE